VSLSDPALVVPLSLFGALMLGCVGLANRLGLAYGKLHESLTISFISSLILLVPLLLVTAWPFEISGRAVGLFALDGLLSYFAVALLLQGVKLIGPSISYAFKSTAPLTAVVLASLVLAEREAWQVYLGALLAVVGAGLLSVERIEGSLVFDRRCLFPALGAVLFGAANVVRRSAMPEVSSPIVGVTWSLFVTLLVSVILMALQRQRLSWNRGGPYFLLGGVFQAIGLVAVYSALASGHVSIVVPLYASSPIFVLALSPLVLGKLERLNRRIVLGVLTTLAGVTLISVFH
jgi:drug/metabolite transporter (DMT)-like permease